MPFFNPAVEPSARIGIAARQSVDSRGLPECTEPTLADRMHDRLDGGLRRRALTVEGHGASPNALAAPVTSARGRMRRVWIATPSLLVAPCQAPPNTS